MGSMRSIFLWGSFREVFFGGDLRVWEGVAGAENVYYIGAATISSILKTPNMIIYGSKATQLTREPISESCPHCQNSNTVDMYVFQRYAHVFWIPFVPVGKTGVSQCGHCKQTLKLRQMPASFRSAYSSLSQSAKTPYWTFVGLGIVALIIVMAIVFG